MDLRALRYLAEVTRLGSITKAAMQLNVAQPALRSLSEYSDFSRRGSAGQIRCGS